MRKFDGNWDGTCLEKGERSKQTYRHSHACNKLGAERIGRVNQTKTRDRLVELKQENRKEKDY